MRKMLFLTIALLVLAGCATNTPPDGEALTIFGRLSQRIQLGSTEETVAYKLQTDDYFITVRGEVLVDQPGEFTIVVTDRATGAQVNDVDVTIYLCQAVDMDIWGLDSCADYDGALYERTFTAAPVDGAYYISTFTWDRYGEWVGAVALDNSAEWHTFYVEVYPARPPSSNTFELVNLSLPFVVIGLFIAILRLRNGQLIQPVQIKTGV